jgi:hypothetical protein
VKVNGISKVASATVPIPIPSHLISAGLLKSQTIQVQASRQGEKRSNCKMLKYT